MSFIGRTPTNAALTSSDLADGIVGTAKIAADAVTAAKIADNAVVTAAINADAVTDAKIADDVVGTEHLTANEVDTAALKGDAVTSAELADDAVDSEHYTDGSIDTAHIADNQVTLAKMAGGTDGNIISFDASGDPVAIATGNDGQVLTSAGAGAPPVFETLPVGGITMVDQWRITADASAGVLTANWERADTFAPGFIGTALSESSGIFTFPSTGIYMINANGYMVGSGTVNYGGIQLAVTLNNSSFAVAAQNFQNGHDNQNFSVFVSYIFDVTNTTTHKFRLVASANDNTEWGGGSGDTLTGVTVIRLGDT